MGAAGQQRPPPGKPDPKQPYGCTGTDAGRPPRRRSGRGVAARSVGVPNLVRVRGVINPMPPIWVTNAQPKSGGAQVDPVVVADQAVQQLPLGTPTIEMAPPAGADQLVRMATWLWIKPGAWQSLTATASAGTVTTTATATPTKVVWNMGDGSTVTCDGAGTPYDPNDPNATTDCSYTWAQSSSDQPGGEYQVTATIYWSVSWTAVGAAGRREPRAQGRPASPDGGGGDRVPGHQHAELGEQLKKAGRCRALTATTRTSGSKALSGARPAGARLGRLLATARSRSWRSVCCS